MKCEKKINFSSTNLYFKCEMAKNYDNLMMIVKKKEFNLEINDCVVV